MNTPPRSVGSLLGAIALHLVLAAVLLYAARLAPVTHPAPVAVELWSAPPASPPPTPSTQPVAATPAAAPEAAAVPPPSPRPEVAPSADTAPAADIQLKRNVRHAPHEASRPSARMPRPAPLLQHPPRPQPQPVIAAKPARAVEKPAAADKSRAAARTRTPPVTVPGGTGKGKQKARHYSDDTNDLLADLNSSNTTHPANARITQAGAANGVAGGVANGSSQARDNYAAKVQAKIRPLVQVPPDIKGNPKAVVMVQLLPTLEVRAVRLIQSSGNPAYDQAVQRAVWDAKTFPSLPAGARFADFRQLRLEFRPS